MVWNKKTGRLEKRWVYDIISQRWQTVGRNHPDFLSGLTLEYFEFHDWEDCKRVFLRSHQSRFKELQGQKV